MPVTLSTKKYLMLVKKLETRTLVSGDKQLLITLEALNPQDISELANLSTKMEVNVSIE